jgi:hypothetical protein
MASVADCRLYDPTNLIQSNRKITAETMKKVQDGLPAQRERTKSSSIGDMTSTHADMALADVRGKLDQRMSVEYAVNEWNRNAQDPANLAVIFIGQSVVRSTSI